MKKKEAPKMESAPAKVWKDENGEVKIVLNEEKLMGLPPLKDVTGVKDTELSTNIIFPAVNAIFRELGYEGACNTIIQSEHDFRPKDALEARLVAQAAVAYQHAMSLIEKGARMDVLAHLESLINLSIKFMRVHIETIEALNRYRRGGEQKVTVTHVAEKMAIFNNFCPQGGGAAENRGDTSCQQYAEPKHEQITIRRVDNLQCKTVDADFTEEKYRCKN